MKAVLGVLLIAASGAILYKASPLLSETLLRDDILSNMELRSHATAPFKEGMVIDCEGGFHFAPNSPMAFSMGWDGTSSLFETVIGWIKKRLDCYCPDSAKVLDEEFARRFLFPQILLNAMSPSSNWESTCAILGDAALIPWKDIKGSPGAPPTTIEEWEDNNGGFPKFNLPSTCDITKYATDGCKIALEVPEIASTINIGIKQCPGKHHPFFTVNLDGLLPNELAKPCNSNDGCAKGFKCHDFAENPWMKTKPEEGDDFLKDAKIPIDGLFDMMVDLGMFKEDTPKPGCFTARDLIANVRTYIARYFPTLAINPSPLDDVLGICVPTDIEGSAEGACKSESSETVDGVACNGYDDCNSKREKLTDCQYFNVSSSPLWHTEPMQPWKPFIVSKKPDEFPASWQPAEWSSDWSSRRKCPIGTFTMSTEGYTCGDGSLVERLKFVNPNQNQDWLPPNWCYGMGSEHFLWPKSISSNGIEIQCVYSKCYDSKQSSTSGSTSSGPCGSDEFFSMVPASHPVASKTCTGSNVGMPLAVCSKRSSSSSDGQHYPSSMFLDVNDDRNAELKPFLEYPKAPAGTTSARLEFYKNHDISSLTSNEEYMNASKTCFEPWTVRLESSCGATPPELSAKCPSGFHAQEFRTYDNRLGNCQPPSNQNNQGYPAGIQPRFTRLRCIKRVSIQKSEKVNCRFKAWDGKIGSHDMFSADRMSGAGMPSLDLPTPAGESTPFFGHTCEGVAFIQLTNKLRMAANVNSLSNFVEMVAGMAFQMGACGSGLTIAKDWPSFISHYSPWSAEFWMQRFSFGAQLAPVPSGMKGLDIQMDGGVVMPSSCDANNYNQNGFCRAAFGKLASLFGVSKLDMGISIFQCQRGGTTLPGFIAQASGPVVPSFWSPTGCSTDADCSTDLKCLDFGSLLDVSSESTDPIYEMFFQDYVPKTSTCAPLNARSALIDAADWIAPQNGVGTPLKYCLYDFNKLDNLDIETWAEGLGEEQPGNKIVVNDLRALDTRLIGEPTAVTNFRPAATCGNGVLEFGEMCDEDSKMCKNCVIDRPPLETRPFITEMRDAVLQANPPAEIEFRAENLDGYSGPTKCSWNPGCDGTATDKAETTGVIMGDTVKCTVPQTLVKSWSGAKSIMLTFTVMVSNDKRSAPSRLGGALVSLRSLLKNPAPSFTAMRAALKEMRAAPLQYLRSSMSGTATTKEVELRQTTTQTEKVSKPFAVAFAAAIADPTAKWMPNLNGIVFTWDVVALTDLPEDLTCQEAFGSFATKFGIGPKCIFGADRKTYHIYFGRNARVLPNDSVTVSEGARLFAQGKGTVAGCTSPLVWSWKLNGMKAMPLTGYNPPAVKVIGNAQDTLGTCNDQVWDISESTGNAGRRWDWITYRLDTTSPTTWADGNTLLGAWDNKTFGKIAAADIPVGKHIVKISLKPWWSAAAFSEAVSFEKFDSSRPNLRLSSTELSIAISQFTKIHAQASIASCSGATSTGSISYSWAITPAPPTPPTGGSAIVLNQRVLEIPAGGLLPNKQYTATVTATDSASSGSVSAAATINTKLQPLFVVVKTGARKISTSQSVVVKAAAVDPDAKVRDTGCTIAWQKWKCETRADATSAWAACSTALDAAMTSTKDLNVDGSTLTAGTQYRFTPSAQKSGTDCGATTVSAMFPPVVTVAAATEATPILVEVLALEEARASIKQRVFFAGAVLGADSTTTAEWAIEPAPAALNTLLVAGTRSDTLKGGQTFLAFKPNVLSAGTSYTITLTATSGTQTGTSSVVFQTNQPPSGGSITSDPTTGSAITTKFGLTALDWTDPEGDLPLFFKFGYLNTAGNVVPLAGGVSSASRAFPTGQGTGNSITIVVICKDSLGDFGTYASTSIVVTPPASLTAAKDAMAAELATLKASGDKSGQIGLLASSANVGTGSTATVAEKKTMLASVLTELKSLTTGSTPAATTAEDAELVLGCLSASTSDPTLITDAKGASDICSSITDSLVSIAGDATKGTISADALTGASDATANVYTANNAATSRREYDEETVSVRGVKMSVRAACSTTQCTTHKTLITSLESISTVVASTMVVGQVPTPDIKPGYTTYTGIYAPSTLATSAVGPVNVVTFGASSAMSSSMAGKTQYEAFLVNFGTNPHATWTSASSTTILSQVVYGSIRTDPLSPSSRLAGGVAKFTISALAALATDKDYSCVALDANDAWSIAGCSTATDATHVTCTCTAGNTFAVSTKDKSVCAGVVDACGVCGGDGTSCGNLNHASTMSPSPLVFLATLVAIFATVLFA